MNRSFYENVWFSLEPEKKKTFFKDSLEDFYKNALSEKLYQGNVTQNIPTKNIYRVFIGRRSFVTVCEYIMGHRSEIDKSILETVYSDVGMRVISKQFAEKFIAFCVENPQKSIDEFPYCIVLFDDILIYGRALGTILSACEEIFADTCEQLNNESNNYPREELYNIFLKFVRIDTAFKNKSSSLLKSRYKKCIIKRDNYFEPRDWRKFSYEIAETTFYASTPNAAFIPALHFTERCSCSDIASAFLKSKAEGLQVDFERNVNQYRGRNIDNYIAVFSENDAVKLVFTVRCTEQYMIPFVLLPSLNELQYDQIINTFKKRLSKCSDVLEKKKFEWNNRHLHTVYAELVNMLLSTVMLRAFLNELGDLIVDSALEITTADVMAYNYAHDKDIAEMLDSLLDKKNPPVFCLSELKTLLLNTIGKEKYIFKGISDIQKDREQNILDNSTTAKIERVMEKTVFDYGIISEKNAYNMLKSYFSPNYDSINYFSFPSDKMVGNFLQKVYAYEDSWIRRHVSLNTAFSYLLQLMDSGCMSLTVGKNNNEYIQCLKTGEQSLNMLIYRYAEYLPLLNEIQQRCKRQGKNTLAGLYYEFNYFFDACRSYGKDNNFDTTGIESIQKTLRFCLIHIVYQLHDSGQECSDYMYLVEKRLNDMNAKISPEDYVKLWKNLYMSIIY